MTIAMTTPTGHVGQHLVRFLIRAGVRPRLLCRDPEALDDDVREAVDAVAGDQRDHAYVREALAGVDAVYWVHPDDWTLPDPEADAAETGRGLVEAVRANGVGRVVLQSTIGAEKRHGAGFLDCLARVEELLDEVAGNEVSVLHLRCAFFMTNLLQDLDSIRDGRIATNKDVSEPMPWVAPVDIASVAAGRLLGPDWGGRHVQAVHGPADLTWPEAAESVSWAVGRKVEAEQLDDDALRGQLRQAGMGDVAVEGIVGMSVGKREGFTPEQPRSVESTTPTTLAAWCADHLADAV